MTVGKRAKIQCMFFINELVQHLPYINYNEKLVIYTDGPSSEFKNKFCVNFLSILSKELNIEVQWKYFATSHGKGVVDGIGGSAKSLVRSQSKSKSSKSLSIQNSLDFFQAAKRLMPNVTVLHISQQEIDSIINEQNPWKEVHAIKGIQVHCITSKDGLLRTALANFTV